MRRRLDLAAALVATPPVLFLDEPTTGLDPRSRAELWRLLGELVDDGAALVLTTQYLEEADRLADDVLVLSAGRTVAHGSPRELKARIGGERLEVVGRVRGRPRRRRGGAGAVRLRRAVRRPRRAAWPSRPSTRASRSSTSSASSTPRACP